VSLATTTTTSTAVQACSDQTSNMLANWRCSWDTSNTAPYQHAGHAVGGAVKSGVGGAAIGLVIAAFVIFALIASIRRRGAATS